jgi:hypothetical protein
MLTYEKNIDFLRLNNHLDLRVLVSFVEKFSNLNFCGYFIFEQSIISKFLSDNTFGISIVIVLLEFLKDSILVKRVLLFLK